MANIVLNSAIRTISGGLDGFVYRQHPDGRVTIARSRTPNPDRVPTQAQAQHLKSFRAASAQCDNLMKDAAILALYKQIVVRRGSAARVRSTIIGDILKPPEIDNLDVSGYHGALGNPIHVLAEDNIGVARITLSITDDATGQVVESAEKLFTGGSLVPPPAGLWAYQATATLPAGHTALVTATAYDLAGNKTELSKPMPG